ncbi:MAG: class I SAM-dependent methyltransferase [Candidatus Thorarchaeota archaeon]
MNEDPSTFMVPPQDIVLPQISTEGLVLDIGGGGEGLVSRIAGNNVCAVDYRISEIREAQIHNPPANWFAADGRALPFQDSTFDIATLWFSLGYMNEWSTKEAVLTEVLRTLKNEGKVLIMASRIDCKEQRLVFSAHFTLPDGTVSKTGYGVRGNQNQILDTIDTLVREVGFKNIQSENHDWWFEVKAFKR